MAKDKAMCGYGGPVVADWFARYNQSWFLQSKTVLENLLKDFYGKKMNLCLTKKTKQYENKLSFLGSRFCLFFL